MSEEIREKLKEWKRTRSIALASDICDELAGGDEWEDYKPKEPLIKDEKIRKAVRAWAEANNIRAVYYSPEEDGFYVKNFDDEIVTSIYFADKPMEEDGYGEHYTIDELCGEEE